MINFAKICYIKALDETIHCSCDSIWKLLLCASFKSRLSYVAHNVLTFPTSMTLLTSDF